MEQKKKPGDEAAARSKPGTRRWRTRLWRWTGFGEKRLWDWLELLGALAIPVVLAVAGFWFTHQQAKQQDRAETQRARTEQALEEQRAQDAALQAYLDQMSALMLGENLRTSPRDGEVRTLARARTLTVLSRLDALRKRSVVQFLYESALIDKNNPIVDLRYADLQKADLRFYVLSDVDLSDARLQKADLRYADLSGAVLTGAVLQGADLKAVRSLSEANLTNADLEGADLEEGDLSDAVLSNAYLNGADLRGADLSNSILDGADLRYAKLGGAVLSGAELGDAILLGANLSGADLSGARGVDTEELEQQLVRLEGTIMPNGTKHD